jgi:hypothetical protein
MHRRSGSISQHLDGLHPGPELSSLIRPMGTPNHVDADVFPPVRSQAPEPSIFLPYMTEDISWEDEYEEYMKGLGYESDHGDGYGQLIGGDAVWERLGGTDLGDGISDSESIVSIGDLGDDARLDGTREENGLVNENLNNWEVGGRFPFRAILTTLPFLSAYES